MINRVRGVTLFEKLTWRSRLLSMREWLVLGVAGGALLSYGIYMAGHGAPCFGERLQMQINLEQSTREIAAAAPQDRAGKCMTYRHQRDLLAKAADLADRCGNETSARGSVDYFADRAAKSRFYASLIERQCADAAP